MTKWLIGVAALAVAQPAAAQSLADAIGAGKPILEVRPRYELVDQAGMVNQAGALTLRTRFGWETGAWHGLKALIEAEDVRATGDYNDGVPPAEPYPVIGDPEVTEINRAQLTWAPGPSATVTLGRQRILLDDQRFVGNVGWRQDEQTFDGVRGDFKLGKLAVTGAWIGQVNRIFAEDLDWDSDSWLARASYPVSDLFTPAAFLYALDFDNAPASSSFTSGVRVTGKTKAGPVGVSYAASYAHQTDYAANPGGFGLDYAAAEVAGTWQAVTLKAAYEQFEGDGVRGFATPLATLHAFQGWADAFLTTPADGLEDRNATLSFKPGSAGPLKTLELTARYHDFETERTGAPLGEELDLLVSAALTKNLTALVKYADYDGVPGFASRTKVWVGFEFKL
ncbi:MAG TPA: alginate export family protein [Caulobacteraceae bacterium]|nr:alginate export family protein [Caulobacteraceae bacterium]